MGASFGHGSDTNILITNLRVFDSGQRSKGLCFGSLTLPIAFGSVLFCFLFYLFLFVFNVCIHAFVRTFILCSFIGFHTAHAHEGFIGICCCFACVFCVQFVWFVSEFYMKFTAKKRKRAKVVADIDW